MTKKKKKDATRARGGGGERVKMRWRVEEDYANVNVKLGLIFTNLRRVFF